MKRLSFFSIVFMMCSMAFAGPVTQDEALQRATQFMASRSHGVAAKGMRMAKRQAAVTPTLAGQQAAYYVFNIDTDGGFVIVSGDDRTPAILGYADSGHFDDATLPDNMKAWLDDYARQMTMLDSGTEDIVDSELPPLTSYSSSKMKAPAVRNSVTPMLTTQWNQQDPYNQQLLDSKRYPDILCSTGCVATAMAQILNYHAQLTGRPECTTAEIDAYITRSGKYRVDGVVKGTKFDWENMLDTYVFGNTADSHAQQKQIDAVAQLMHICGASVKMNYTTGSSDANCYDVPDALKVYFGFDDATRIVQRKDYTIRQWNSVIYTELIEQRPVIFFGESSGGGHAFIIDGFDGDEMYHINWGWGGHCDGYYLLTLANPSDKQGTGAGNSDDGYNMTQFAVIGAQPDDGIVFEQGNAYLTFSNISAKGNAVNFSAFNFFEKTAVFDFGIGYFKDDGTIAPITIYNSGSGVPKNYGYDNLSLQIQSLPVMGGNVAKLALISREAGTEEWNTPMNPDNYYIEGVNTGGNVVLTMVMPKLSLKVEDLSFGNELRAMHTHKVDVTICNSGDEFYGKIHFISQRMGYALKDTLSVGATVLSGQSSTVQFPFRPIYEGQYEVMIAAEGDASGAFFVDTLDVADGWTSKNVNLDIDIKIANLNNSGTAILGSKALLVTTVTNNTDTDFEGMFLMKLVEPGVRFTYVPATKYFDAHTTTVIEEEYDVAESKSYIPVCLVGDGNNPKQVTQNPQVAYRVEPSVTIYMADGTHIFKETTALVEIPDSAVAVEIMDNSTTKSVTPSKNPNCLYYLPNGATKPSGLTTNTVIGSHTENLVIEDSGLPFTPIAAFTADNVSYTRKFENGVKAITDSLGTAVLPYWTTICLPFMVEKCIIGGKVTVDWMHQVEDSTYNFWLMEYLGDENNTLFFAPADTMKAYTPYLIAVPAGNLKGLYDMTVEPVTFSGSNAVISTGTTGIAASTNYKFMGSMKNESETGWVYNIETDGMKCHRDNVNVQPFRAYVKAMSNSTHTIDVPISIAATITVEADINVKMKGDVNGDSYVDVADISAVISAMAGVGQDEWTLPADVNGDGTVDVADISSIINIMAQ